MATQEWKNNNIDKVRAYRNKWYANNKDVVKDYRKQRKQEMRQWLQEKKQLLSCNRCGENHPACICFHHINPDEKETAIASTLRNGWSKERIEKEISKCEVLCHNCHSKVHWE